MLDILQLRLLIVQIFEDIAEVGMQPNNILLIPAGWIHSQWSCLSLPTLGSHMMGYGEAYDLNESSRRNLLEVCWGMAAYYGEPEVGIQMRDTSYD